MPGKRLFLVSVIFIIFLKMVGTLLKAPQPNTDIESLRASWIHSQYNLGRGWEFFGNLSDADLYTLAGMEYIKGQDPTIINFEQPPLAKYILGFSDLVLGNMLIAPFSFGLLSLLTVYLLSRRLGMSKAQSLIPPLILAFDPLFVRLVGSVNLDIIQLAFVLLAIFSLLSQKLSAKICLWLGLLVGAVMASKALFTGVLLMIFVLGFLFLSENLRKKFKFYLLVVGGCLVVYLASYSVFLLNHPIADFLRLHIRILQFYRSYLPEYPWFEIFRILILGKWRTWFAQPVIQPVSEYWIAWPLASFLSLLIFIKKLVNKRYDKSMIIFSWIVVHLAFQSTHVVFPRYLILSLPFIYILSVYSVYQLARGNLLPDGK